MEPRKEGLARALGPNWIGAVLEENDPGAKEVSGQLRCALEVDPDGRVWIGIGGDGLPVAVDFQELLPGD